jgi:uncharacterized protein (DUF433 family)
MAQAPLPQYTPQEAAALAGVRLGRIQNAITNRQLGRGFTRQNRGRRNIDLPAVLTFALMQRLEKIHVDPKALYEVFRRTGLPSKPIAVTDAVTIDAPRLLEPVIRNIQAYDAARQCIVSDPAVMGGLPVVKGTRIPARTLHARVKGGDAIASILKEYPYLDRKTVEAAVLFIEANPSRGRPRQVRRRPHG